MKTHHKEQVKKLVREEFMKGRRSAIRRKGFYKKLSEKNGIKEDTIRDRVHRMHLTKREHNLACAFTKEREDVLASMCVVHT